MENFQFWVITVQLGKIPLLYFETNKQKHPTISLDGLTTVLVFVILIKRKLLSENEVKMTVFDAIITRRSIRQYSNQIVSSEDIARIIQAAVYAPSGKNGQPWRFRIVTDKTTILKLAQKSNFNKWMTKASCVIVVFLDRDKSYDYVKDIQSCGAAMQNILLTAHSLHIGGCWIGEFLDCAQDVRGMLDISNEQLELMGIISLGYPIREVAQLPAKRIEDYLI